MKAHELARLLLEMPNTDIAALYDGGIKLDIDHAYISKGGKVRLCDNNAVLYNNSDRPQWAPSSDIDKFWHMESEER